MWRKSTKGNANTDAATLVVQEQEQLRSMISEWMVQQRTQQERFIDTVLQVHRETLQELQRIGPDTGQPNPTTEATKLRAQRGDSRPDSKQSYQESKEESTPFLASESGTASTSAPLQRAERSTEPAPVQKEQGVSNFEEATTRMDEDDAHLEHWKRSSGMHTVIDWIANYENHPAGWGALLMIHGIPEITGRLRNKVDNFAIYSALFLSMSIACLVGPPDVLADGTQAPEWSTEWWIYQVRMRAYMYGFAIGTASHMLSILLGMSFSNALNEAARDCDVYRMFSQGKAFFATVKSETSFQVGCAADYIAVVACSTAFISWQEVLIGTGLLLSVTWWILSDTKGLLFSNASITEYWRGGPNRTHDPYDLGIPVECARARADAEPYLTGKGAVDAMNHGHGEHHGHHATRTSDVSDVRALKAVPLL
eukprot:TRINITY_DN79312_c0_g1_i1.p1 TRINITY_DN79312_c0_g1~~TRINITY_DN79312_c0_g1_i1.p1  ORF type:complete len:445 (-),score=61.90 TRINITY_DN79312_c0_g1_i1:86-1360(-)